MQSAEGLADRNGRVRIVELVEVEVVGPEPPQAVLDDLKKDADISNVKVVRL